MIVAHKISWGKCPDRTDPTYISWGDMIMQLIKLKHSKWNALNQFDSSKAVVSISEINPLRLCLYRANERET